MKNAIVLALIFYGYQGLVSLLFILNHILHHNPEPLKCNGAEIGLISLLSGIMMIGHLLFCKNATFRWKSFFEVPIRYLLLCLPLVLSAMFFLNVLMEFIPLPNYGEETFYQMSTNIFGILATVLMAPFVEELLFRGAIEHYFLKTGKSATYAIGMSALLFGIFHGNPAQIPFAFLLGLLLGWLYYRTGSIVPGVLCHFVNNGIAILTMNLQPDGKISGSEGFSWSLALYLCLAVVIFVCSFVYARKHFPTKQWEIE